MQVLLNTDPHTGFSGRRFAVFVMLLPPIALASALGLALRLRPAATDR